MAARLSAQVAGQAFGRLQKMLADLPGPRLNDAILDLHHTPKRFAALTPATDADVVQRAQAVRVEIELALRCRTMCHLLAAAGWPERVTRNDTKHKKSWLVANL